MFSNGSRWRLAAAITIVAPLLAACSSDRPTVQQASAPLVGGVTTQALVGRWGVGAYHRDEDRGRTEREARAQCRNPYVIKAGPTGGVMMHLADEKEPFELTVKSAGGRTILGPDNAPDSYNDREITAFDGNSFTTRWLDSEIAGRYGMTIYIRCGAAAPGKRT